MPLPDERPRQSVANLIGRFEKQKSSTSSSAPPIAFPRTSSVTSHRTDDSAQEEVKEKREWPPKAVDTSATSVSQSFQLPQKRSTPPLLALSNDKEQRVSPEQERPSPPAAPKSVSPSTPHPTLPQSTPAKAKSPAADPTAKPKVKSPPPSQIKSASTRASAKSPVPKPTKGPLEESSKQPPGTPAASSSTPLKSQHTGQSTTSTHTATRVAVKPRASAPPKTPAAATPARSRTPLAAARPKTPSSAPRTGTPLSTTRPKTPSGLYAPTAASLARSKAGAPTPPPPEKPKRKVTTDLSKPTAASASRMRSPAVIPAAKVGKSSAGKPATSKVVKTTVPKAAAPIKRHAVTKPPTEVKTAAGGNKGETKSLGVETTTATEVAGAAATIAAQEVAEVPLQVPDDGTVVEGVPELTDHLANEHEQSTPSGEHLELEAQQSDSHDGEDIESYDEDFPEDSHETLEVHEEPENGHVVAIYPDSTSVTEEPVEEHATGSATSLHDNGASLGEDGEAPQTPEKAISELHHMVADSRDVGSEVHDTEDTSRHESVGAKLEEESKSPKVGTDLEDIVNLLESGPHISRPSVDSSAVESTVSEAGSIPDEY